MKFKYCVDIHILEEFKMKKFNVTVNGTAYDVEVNEVKASAGQAVKKGETLLILEAMKMQNEIAAPHDAVVAEVRVAANQTVSTGDDMVVLG